VAEIRFGIETTTLDAAGEVTATHDMTGLTPTDVAAAATGFVGDIRQVPPMVSALKVGGRRLHELAREGVEVEREARPVHVARFDVAPTHDPLVWRAEVDCSSGTYVRTLAADLGHALGGGAHLASLRRTAVGRFTLDDARTLEEIELLPMRDAMRGFASVAVGDDVVARVRVGAVLGPDDLAVEGPPPWAVLDEQGDLLAVYEAHRDGVRRKPSVVLSG
jgi:tRNA pseudouridine55 synthase